MHAHSNGSPGWLMGLIVSASLALPTCTTVGQNIFDVDPKAGSSTRPAVQPKPAPPAPPAADPPMTVDAPESAVPEPVGPPAPTLAPVPPQQEVAAATARIRNIFSKEYANDKEEAIRNLAGKLNGQARDASNDPATRFALFREAYSQGERGRDITRMVHVASDMADAFKIEPFPMYFEAVLRVGPTWKSPESNLALSEMCMALSDVAYTKGDLDLAARVLAIGNGAATKSKDVRTVGEMDRRVKRINWMRIEQTRVKPSLQKLATTPTDAAASLVAGRWYCLVMQDWTAGLPVLAAGTPGLLQKAAALEVSNPPDAPAQLATGHAWWDAAAKETGEAQDDAKKRAAMWYRRAMSANAMTGLEVEAIKKRVTEADAIIAADIAKSGDVIIKNKRYRAYHFSALRSTAERFCIALGGQLPIIQNEAEQKAATAAAGGKSVWIGATDDGSEGRWKWPDGQPMNYRAWKPREPSNSNGVEHYSHLGPNGWNDVPLRSPCGILVEWVIP